MSGSGTGANAGNVGMQNPPPATPHSMRLAYSAADGTAVYRAVVGSSSAGNVSGGMGIQPKKRGRPRKYAPSVPPMEVAAASAPPAFTPPPPPPPAQPSRGASRSRKPRGRRPGSGSGSGSRMMQQSASLGIIHK